MSNTFPDDLHYTKEHEWARVEGKVATFGITEFAVESLGDITAIDFQVAEGDKVRAGQVIASVESVKAVSDIFAPVSGTVRKVNDPMSDSPETLNDDCYDEGWLVQVEPADEKELDKLMKADAYGKYVDEQGH